MSIQLSSGQASPPCSKWRCSQLWYSSSLACPLPGKFAMCFNRFFPSTAQLLTSSSCVLDGGAGRNCPFHSCSAQWSIRMKEQNMQITHITYCETHHDYTFYPLNYYYANCREETRSAPLHGLQRKQIHISFTQPRPTGVDQAVSPTVKAPAPPHS